MFAVGDKVALKDSYHRGIYSNVWIVTVIFPNEGMITFPNEGMITVRHEYNDNFYENISPKYFVLIQKRKREVPQSEVEYLDRFKENFKNGV